MSNSETISPNKTVELIFSSPQLEMLQSTAQIKLFMGGLGSGKTYLMGANNTIMAKKYPQVRGFIGANTYQQLTKSTLVGVFNFFGKVGLKRDIDYVVDKMPPPHFKIFGERLKKYDNTISFSNGKLIFLGSLDNFEAIAGQEFAHADLDETRDTEEEAVKEVILPRLRQKGLWLNKRGEIVTEEAPGLEGYCPLAMYTSPAKTAWLSEWFDFPKYEDEITDSIFSKTDYFRKRVGQYFMVICSSYHNEDNQPAGYIESKIIEPNKHNEHLVNMNLWGSPLAKNGGEYFSRYERRKHVMQMVMPDNIATHISFDFNRRPYITSGLYRAWFKKESQRWHSHKFDEVCLMPPNNTCADLCDEIIKRWAPMLKSGLYYYGDYSGNNARTNSVDDDYDVIERKFKPFLHSNSNRVIVNQPVVKRKEFMNRILYGSLPIDFTMDPRCVNTIKDFEFLMEGTDGGKDKKKVSDDNGKQYEKYGHCADETEYYYTSAFNQYFKL